jgi:hypothetical protein
MSQLVSKSYEYNTTMAAIFSKTYGENTLQCRIKTIVVLTGGKLTWIYFLQFTFCNNAPMPRQEGKYPHAEWYEFWPCCLKVRFGWGSPYHAVGADVHRAMSHDRVIRASRDLRMSCGNFHKTWICSCDICSAVHAALNTWAPLGGYVVMYVIYVYCALLQVR